MNAKELIEKQISEAAQSLAGIGPGFDRPIEISNGIIGLAVTCERLLQVVQNQQSQIESMQDALGYVPGGEDDDRDRELRLKAAYKEGEL